MSRLLSARRAVSTSGMRSGRQRGLGASNDHGFTLVELLVACSLTAIVLVLATNLTVQARRAVSVGGELAYRQQIEELAKEVLQYHLGLAGYRGLEPGGPAMHGPSLVLHRGAAQGGSDRFTVRYVEERWYRNPQLKVFDIEARRDSSRVWNLYLREEGSTRQPAVRGVTGVRLIGVVTGDGEREPPTVSLPLEALALELRVEFAWESAIETVVVLPRPVTISEGSG